MNGIMKKNAISGFSLVEMLVTISIMGAVANTLVPLLSSTEPQKLTLAAEETANTLRFALSEAKRTGGYVLVDGKNTSGHLKLYYSTNNANLTTAITDPQTKRAADLNVDNRDYSKGVTLTPQFRAGASTLKQLLIGPALTQMQAFDGVSNNKGTLEANSGVLLVLGSQSVLVSINQKTGQVTLP
jgi:prepilin-type N-terminal cleavage/methylation domain-containing protein